MRVLHVTEILSPFSDFEGVPVEVLESASLRGIGVHQACLARAGLLYFAGAVPVEYGGYVESFENWLGEFVDRVYFVELRVEDRVFGITGRIDMGAKLTDGRKLIVDLKTPATESKTWKGQLAAYLYLVNDSKNRPKKYGKFGGSMSLILDATGKAARGIPYRFHAEDLAAFFYAMNAVRYFKG